MSAARPLPSVTRRSQVPAVLVALVIVGGFAEPIRLAFASPSA